MDFNALMPPHSFMKQITTLVPDILDLVGNEDREALSFSRMEGFAQALASKITTRLGESRGGSSDLRMSNLGTPCERKLWYRVNAAEKAEPLPNEARMKFLYGDILEELLLFLAKETGHVVEDEQKEVTYEGVTGHIDAIVDGVLIDCKSASTYSFQKFQDGLTPENDAFGYLTQLDLYLNALNLPMGGFLVIDKTLGKICLDLHMRSDKNWPAEIARKKEILAGSLPSRGFSDEPDGKSGNRKLGVACSYCEFKQECWPEIRTFLYSSGPRFLTRVSKTPEVKEV